MTRTQIYLGGLLLVQVALILFLRTGSTDAATTSGSRPLLPDFDPAAVTRLAIVDSDASLELERRGDGWSIPAQDGFPADAEKVRDLLDTLGGATVGRPVVSSGRHHGTFKVSDDEFMLKLRAWDEEGTALADLILGTGPNLRTSHLRRAGSDEVFEARGLSTYDYRPLTESWIERMLIDESPASVSGFSLTNARGTIEAVRVEGGWRTADDGRPLDPEKVESLLRRATSLRIERAAGRVDPVTQGFESPAATLRLRVGEPDSGTRDVALSVGAGADDEASTRYVTRSDFEFAGIVGEDSVSEFLDDIDLEATGG